MSQPQQPLMHNAGIRWKKSLLGLGRDNMEENQKDVEVVHILATPSVATSSVMAATTEGVGEPMDRDVICGRPSLSKHPGNIHFRRLIEIHAPLYMLATKKIKKREIVTQIISALSDRSSYSAYNEDIDYHNHAAAHSGEGARFVKWNKDLKEWHVLTKDQIHTKVSHALRDRVQELKAGKKLKTTTKSNKNTSSINVKASLTLTEMNENGQGNCSSRDIVPQSGTIQVFSPTSHDSVTAAAIPTTESTLQVRTQTPTSLKGRDNSLSGNAPSTTDRPEQQRQPSYTAAIYDMRPNSTTTPSTASPTASTTNTNITEAITNCLLHHNECSRATNHFHDLYHHDILDYHDDFNDDECHDDASGFLSEYSYLLQSNDMEDDCYDYRDCLAQGGIYDHMDHHCQDLDLMEMLDEACALTVELSIFS